MTQPRYRRLRNPVVLIAALLLIAGFWKLHSNSMAADAHRAAWETRALQLHVPVYPARPVRMPFIGTVYWGWLPRRPETIVQTLSETEVENLLRLELKNSPEGMVIMVGGISNTSRSRLAERYPNTLIVDYPNMPQ